ncbi:ISLre2 family transposase [Alicyclobacillus sendaiensis]|uniref:ISLre2 family transposase n=1 Tax=Alicyclobacillus sendaiensis TaxID=192387 RepID=UPI0007852B86|nr:ISLre2 family transposase [Alicyclobacillus sendaiensis]
MLDIRRAFFAFLHVWSTVQELAAHPCNFSILEENVVGALTTAAGELIQQVLEVWDEWLAEQRDKREWELVHRKFRTIATTVGEITYQRRYYRNKETGERRFLLDDAVGLEPRRRLSAKLREQAVALALDVSYHRAAEILRTWVPDISAMAIWQEVQRLGGTKRARAALERDEVFGRGASTPGTREVDTLYVEADGVYVRSRRQEEGKSHLEVKLAVAYEGKDERKPDRRALVTRYVVAGTEEGERFWEEAVTAFGRVWDWRHVERCWLGTDGAAWAKQGADMLPSARHRLDPFHLRQALVRALGRETETYRKVWDALKAEDWARVEAVLTKAERRSQGAKKQRIARLKGYLKEHWDGIVDSGDVVSLGVIEGQVFHHVARRMKRHGARWSKQGADALVRLMAARANGETLQVIAQPECVKPTKKPVVPTRVSVNEAEIARKVEDAARWLSTHMPALVGPHAGRPWVKYVLRELARLPHTIA